MRIKTVDDLEANLNTKVFYLTAIPDTLDDFEKYPESVHSIRSACKIYPCRLEKRVNMDLSGFRMNGAGTSGRSFDCKNSVCYVFKPIRSPKEGKKLKVDTSYFSDTEGRSMFEYEHVDIEWNGFSRYIDVTTWDGTQEKCYTVNSLVSKSEYEQNEYAPDGMVFITQARVFTEAYEAYSLVKYTAATLADEMIKRINEQAEQEKGIYYNFKYNIERGCLY